MMNAQQAAKTVQNEINAALEEQLPVAEVRRLSQALFCLRAYESSHDTHWLKQAALWARCDSLAEVL